ncbi:MAG: ATP-binding protein [Candidatus Thorarchaeota archaeon]|jgi:Pyruvate/2-oxoacid:ferredoxin oxidoreductase delta subunit
MPTDPYEQLAATLDKIPNGFTATEDGSHLRLLKWIFTPEEAILASNMKLRGETTDEFAERLGIYPDGLEDRLEKMAEKGQIRAWNSSTGRRYALLPVVVGIHDEQMHRMDSEYAQLVEDYLDSSRFQGLWGTEPALFKVIPIHRTVSTDLEIHPYEMAEQMIESSRSWGVRECICKKQQNLLGNPCKHGVSKCIQLHPRKENVFDETDLTNSITKDEALAILREAEEAGLVHCSMNTQGDHLYICNCCSCCCLPLRGLSKWEQPHAFVRSNFQAAVKSDLCTGCESCLDRCPVKALIIPDDVCQVITDRCIGCGVCSISCPENALHLVSRDQEDKNTPPESIMDWGILKAFSRGVDPSDLA